MKTIPILIITTLTGLSAFADDSGFKYAHETQPTKRQIQDAQRQYNPVVNGVIHYNANHGAPLPPSNLGQQSHVPIQSQSGTTLKSLPAR